MSDMEQDIRDTRQEAVRLLKLLEEPEIGCFTYVGAVTQQVERLARAWNGPMAWVRRGEGTT